MFDSLPDGRLGRAICAVLTIVPEEQEAARKLIGTTSPLVRTPYFVSEDGAGGTFRVVMRQAADRGNIAANEAASSLMEDFRPSVVFLIGIAGGVKDRDGTQLGDVVVADFVEYYELRKLSGGKSMPRRQAYDHPSLWLRENITQPLCSPIGSWANPAMEGRPGTGSPTARVGNILTGEKLFGDQNNAYQAEILREYDKALAVDMESYGFARAMFKARSSVHYNPQYAIIRGISDFAQSENTEGGAPNESGMGTIDPEVSDNDAIRRKWRSHAAETAAAFTAETIKILVQE